MYVNIIHSYRNIIAIADKELIGKNFEEGKKQLDVKESFYKGELKTPKEVTEILEEWIQEDAIFNIVGEKAIQLALKSGVIAEKGIGKIENIPYTLILL